jgi:hypothetical protein
MIQMVFSPKLMWSLVFTMFNPFWMVPKKKPVKET